MINIKDFKTIYKLLNSNTRLIFKTTLTTTVCLILAAIYAYNSNQYELVKISDDMLEVAKTVMLIGFTGTIFIEYIKRNKKTP